MNGLKLHRVLSWLLALFALLTIFLGYVNTRRWFTPIELYLLLHLVIEWFFIGTLVIHSLLSIRYYKHKWSRMIKGLKSKRARPIYVLRLIQLITNRLIIVFAVLVVLSGLIYYEWFAASVGKFISFNWHTNFWIFGFDLLLSIFIIMHVAVGAKFFLIRKKLNHWSANIVIILIGASLTSAVVYLNIPSGLAPPQITIGGKTYDFVPADIETVRPDLFQNGSFSVFDILYHLNLTGRINISSQFNASLNTWVIDSIDGQQNNWYHVYYSGGDVETNVFRMDHYPWKPGTTITLYQETSLFLSDVYSTFEKEVIRNATNGGLIVIPTVIIDGRTFYQEFYNVTIVAHNLRNDTFQNGTITAIDVIMTLGDLGNITYELQWYETLGTADYVRSYWVNQINSDETIGRCGFVYEEGDLFFDYVRGNYIQLPSDFRILNSPEYIKFFWKCL